MNTFQRKVLEQVARRPATEMEIVQKLGYSGQRGLEAAIHCAVADLLRKLEIEQRGTLLVHVVH